MYTKNYLMNAIMALSVSSSPMLCMLPGRNLASAITTKIVQRLASTLTTTTGKELMVIQKRPLMLAAEHMQKLAGRKAVLQKEQQQIRNAIRDIETIQALLDDVKKYQKVRYNHLHQELGGLADEAKQVSGAAWWLANKFDK